MSLHKITYLLLVLGGLNWLLEALGYGIGQYMPESIAMLLYVIIGLSAVYSVLSHKKVCLECQGKRR